MFAAVFIPNFSLQAALRQEPELPARPVALIDPASSKPNIVQLTAAARERGVVEGLTASQAMARCGELLIRPRSPAQEQTATDILLQTVYAFSPSIEATAPGVCTAELKGLGLGNDQVMHSWAGQLVAALKSVELSAQTGIAITPALALLAAQDACPVRIVRDSTTFVSTLPVAALGPDPELSEVLERWGIRTVGALLALRRAELAERLGPEILPLLNRVSSQAIRPLKLVEPKQTFEEETGFENEIETVEPLLFVLHRFVEQLARRLEVLHLVVAQLDLKLKLSSGAVYERSFRIPAPTGDVNTLFRTLQTHLETVRTDASIVALRLEAISCQPQTHQFGLFETTLKDPNQFAETLARLMSLCGSERVGTPAPASSHRPDAFQMRTPHFDRDEEGQHSDSLTSQNGATTQVGLTLRRFRPPLPAFVELREQRPVLLRSEVFNGAILNTRGPFLISGDWWDRQAWEREEWDVRAADGGLYRVFRAEGEFFVEGVYD